MQPPKSSICVICGIRPATTSEHIPPRGFFKGIIGQFRTVPACDICNKGSSADDETLRNYISLQIGKQTIGAEKLWEEGTYKSLKRSKKIRTEFLNSSHEVKVRNEDGIVNNRLLFFVPENLYQRIFEKITRGLFFWHTEQILPANIPVKISLLIQAPNLDELKDFEIETIAEDAFVYRFAFGSEGHHNSLWLFCIHNSHWVQASTGILVFDCLY